MVGITFDHDSTAMRERVVAVEAQVVALLDWVRVDGPARGIDASRLGV